MKENPLPRNSYWNTAFASWPRPPKQDHPGRTTASKIFCRRIFSDLGTFIWPLSLVFNKA